MNNIKNLFGKLLAILFVIYSQIAFAQPVEPPGGGGPGGGPVGVPLDGSDIFILVFAGVAYLVYRHIKELKKKETINE
jgi:glycine cleavage system protein P-like pyridoxal-binding family